MTPVLRAIDSQLIVDSVADAVKHINHVIDPSIREYFIASQKKANELEHNVLDILVKNADIAKQSTLPLCQDTGLVVVFAQIGTHLLLDQPISELIQQGVAKGYIEGFLRKSIVKDPLYDRTNTGDNTPAIVHIEIVSGNRLSFTLVAKGGGSENASALAMFTPSNTDKDITDWVVEKVQQKGRNACPPLLLGIGIGGDFEYSAVLAKKALNRPIGQRNKNEAYANLERSMIDAVNGLRLGAGGYGGRATVMDVFIEMAPCHIASLPVALNVSCHSTRHITVEL